MTLDDMVDRVCERRIGLGLNQPMIISKYRSQKNEVDDGRLIRVSTPLEYVRPADIPSPSESKADSISLPSDTQMQKEKERIARERYSDVEKAQEKGKPGHKKTKSHLVGNDTIKEESITTVASTDDGMKQGKVQIRVKGTFDIQKMKQNAAREARVKLNKMVNKTGMVDYLTQAR